MIFLFFYFKEKDFLFIKQRPTSVFFFHLSSIINFLWKILFDGFRLILIVAWRDFTILRAISFISIPPSCAVCLHHCTVSAPACVCRGVCRLACVSTLMWSDRLWSVLLGPSVARGIKNTMVSSCFKSLSSALLIGKSHRPYYKTNAVPSGPQGLWCVRATLCACVDCKWAAD